MAKHIIVDVESDGPIIGVNSMVCFAAVVLDKTLNQTFYSGVKPISKQFDAKTLAISGITRKEHEQFDDPFIVFNRFEKWLSSVAGKTPVLLSDNNGYDAAWINYYFLSYLGKNPFGWSSRRIGDMFAGFYNDPHFKWKQFRKTQHTHNPLDDAMGNAEAMQYLISQGFKLKL